MTKDKEKSGAEEETPKQEENPTKKVSARKIIYVDLDEEITQVYDRVKRLKMTEIYLVVPKKAALLQSVVNLKILKRKLTESGKKLFLVTNDEIGIHLAMQAGIKVYEKIAEPKEDSKLAKVLNPKLKITPLKALKNPEEEGPRRLAGKKLSIFELSKGLKQKKVNLFAAIRQKFKRPRKKTGSSKPKLVLWGPQRGGVTTLVVASILILLTISYIALPGATIYLIPKSNVREISVNVTLADVQKNAAELSTHPPHMLASYPVEKEVIKTISYPATGQLFQGKNARGKIKIVNKAPYVWPLIARTRFQTQEGIVYRTFAFVSVSAATKDGPGSLIVEVEADEFDAYGQVAGERGNITESEFFLPGLRESSRETLYGELEGAMSGGETLVIKQISREDIDAATEKAKEEAINAIEADMQVYVAELNRTQNNNLSLLTGRNAVNHEEPQVEPPYELEGQQIESFEVTAAVLARGVAYNHDEFINILKTDLRQKKSPEKRISKMQEDSITYRIFEINETTQRIKLTATIRGIEEFEIDPEKENGARLIKKIKEHVLGMKVPEALSYIQNLPEIQRVQIKTRPVWAPSMPNIPDNIDIVMMEE